MTDYRESLRDRPEVVLAANNLAWCLVAMPGRGDADEAVGWARGLVEDPQAIPITEIPWERPSTRGRFAAAIVELEHNVARNTATAGYDWVFLAICKQRLGHRGAAGTALSRALKWRLPANRNTPATIAEFQSLLDRSGTAVISQSSRDLPASVFAG